MTGLSSIKGAAVNSIAAIRKTAIRNLRFFFINDFLSNYIYEKVYQTIPSYFNKTENNGLFLGINGK
ncbi:MAG: hypothetical protein IJO68_03635 [Clostridia bacterium]|nr:hypothetical protein [Clostridia bacterium]